jgi:membrane-bound metal-dependent hydrolase YbcI (DUF457 family)
MDPVSHAAFARTLIALGSDRLVRGSVTAAVVGALSPDLDAIVMPFGWDRYLRIHEIGTHTIVGTLGCALLVAAVVRTFARGSPYLPLTAAAWIGAASHILLDLLSSARLKPAWPLVDAVVSLPAVAMADPYLLALCVAGPVSIWLTRERQECSARMAVSLIAVFLLAKGVLGFVAFASYRDATRVSGAPVEARVIEAAWASLTEWRVLDRTSLAVRQWRVRAGSGAELLLEQPVGSAEPIVERSRSLSTVRNFLSVHALAFATTRPTADGLQVLWSDIRFCWNAGATREPRLDCALWFGGDYDHSGRPLREIVQVITFTQTRAAGP